MVGMANSLPTDRYLLVAKPTAANPPPQQRTCGGRMMGQTDRQTNAAQFHKPCSAYYANSVNNIFGCHTVMR